MTTSNFASQAGHWYGADGTPRYTITGANGNERATTLRDARKFGYMPSVTTIIKCAAAPGLENWKIDQALMSALTLPRNEGEGLDAFMVRAKLDSKEQAIKAAQAGTALHASLEGAFSGGFVDPMHTPHVASVRAALAALGIAGNIWHTERSFACSLGYGGKLDLHSDAVVIDFKGKPSIEDGKDYGFDEQAMQLAAYARGLNMPNARLINLFVGIQDAKVSVKEWEPSPRYFAQFKALLDYWQAKNGYVPGAANAA